MLNHKGKIQLGSETGKRTEVMITLNMLADENQGSV
jgi:hypothetical protein